jgi:hypothetical protein
MPGTIIRIGVIDGIIGSPMSGFCTLHFRSGSNVKMQSVYRIRQLAQCFGTRTGSEDFPEKIIGKRIAYFTDELGFMNTFFPARKRRGQTSRPKRGWTRPDIIWLTYDADMERMKICFCCLVIKLSSLREKYPGGPRAFFKKYIGRCNRDIFVMCEMADWYLDEPIHDMQEHGLIYKVDFAHIEESIFSTLGREIREDEEIIEDGDCGIKWLSVITRNDGIYVCFRKNETEDQRGS